MGERERSELAGSFGRAAAEYERARPGYPAEAVDWLVPEGARTVLDLGAGTGKLTRSLLERGLEAIAVEPSAQMRATLAAELPGVRALGGTAEEIPLPAASVDAITVAQAWHWVEEARAVPEAARVLRPGGRLGLIWNIRDEETAWVRRLTEVMHKSGAEIALEGEVEIGAPFGPTESFELPWERPMTLELLLEMVRSRSYVITASPPERGAILAGVRALVEAEPALAGGAEFELPYVTRCFRATLG
jgi:SAM-dependent methyltransferase